MRILQGARDVFWVAAEVSMIIVECVFLCKFWSIWEDRSVGGVFGDFEGEVCIFPGYDTIVRFFFLGFFSGGGARLEAGVCIARERLQVWRERHCQVFGGKKM